MSYPILSNYSGIPNERSITLKSRCGVRGVFLTLLFKDEIGADIYEDALRVLVRGVAIQLLEH